MRFLSSGLNISKSDWIKSAQEIVYALLLGLLPIWMGAIVIVVFQPQSPVTSLLGSREIVLFSTALLATGFFHVGQEFRKSPFPARIWFLLVLIVLMVLSTAVFSGIVITGSRPADRPANEVALRYVSACIFFLSVIFVFMVSAINKAQTVAELQPEEALDAHAAESEKLQGELSGYNVELPKEKDEADGR